MKLIRIPLVVLSFFLAAAGMTRWSAINMLGETGSPLAQFFLGPDGLPCQPMCLFGIQPGITSFYDSGDVLKQHPFTRKFSSNMAGDIFRSGTMGILILWGSSGENVMRVEWFTNGLSAWERFGEIIQEYGKPDRVALDRDCTHSFWYDGRLEFIHGQIRPGFVSPDDPLVGVAVQTTPDDYVLKTVPWRGFNSVARYLSATP